MPKRDIDAFRMDAPDGILTLLSDVRSRTIVKPMVAVMDGGENGLPNIAVRKAEISVSGAYGVTSK